jgi:dUTP pyrophosphatase
MDEKLIIEYTKDTSTKYTSDPPKFEKGNAATDLRSAMYYKLMPNETHCIQTSFKMKIPEGYCGVISSRSGLALKNSIFVLNSVGLVDPAYRGVIGVILHNASRVPFEINPNDRIAQIIFMRFEEPDFISRGIADFSAETTPRGDKGFGSSGIK